MSEKQKKEDQPKTVNVKSLEKRIEKLERALAKMAHMSGNHRIMVEFGIDPWVPGKEDMSKYKDGK